MLWQSLKKKTIWGFRWTPSFCDWEGFLHIKLLRSTPSPLPLWRGRSHSFSPLGTRWKHGWPPLGQRSPQCRGPPKWNTSWNDGERPKTLEGNALWGFPQTLLLEAWKKTSPIAGGWSGGWSGSLNSWRNPFDVSLLHTPKIFHTPNYLAHCYPDILKLSRFPPQALLFAA